MNSSNPWSVDPSARYQSLLLALSIIKAPSTVVDFNWEFFTTRPQRPGCASARLKSHVILPAELVMLVARMPVSLSRSMTTFICEVKFEPLMSTWAVLPAAAKSGETVSTTGAGSLGSLERDTAALASINPQPNVGSNPEGPRL